jgi:transcriptional regulator with XRE-family HTH domain
MNLEKKPDKTSEDMLSLRSGREDGGKGRRSPFAFEIDQYIGGRIRFRRSLLGMSQDEVSKQLGVTFQQLQKYEMGTNRCSGSTMYVLARILRCVPGYFFDGLPELEELAASPMVKLDVKRNAKILRAFEGLDRPGQVDAVLKLVRALVDTDAQKATAEFLE